MFQESITCCITFIFYYTKLKSIKKTICPSGLVGFGLTMNKQRLVGFSQYTEYAECYFFHFLITVSSYLMQVPTFFMLPTSLDKQNARMHSILIVI